MVLRIEGLTKHFGGVKALEQSTFAISPNNITGIVGPNGGGKTTLFDVVTGYLTADSGSVYFQDKNITGLAPHRVARLGIARTFQLVRLYRDLSVIDNLLLSEWFAAMPLLMKILVSPSRLHSREDRLRSEALSLLEQVMLGDESDSLAGELSYGQQKVLEIIRAILAKPSLLLFDEPAAGLDPSIKEVVAGLIIGLKEQGKTVVLIEHDLGFVRSICDQVVVLDQGAPIFIGAPGGLAEDPFVRERYLSEGAYM